VAPQINEEGIILMYIFISREFPNKVVAMRPLELIDLVHDLSQSCDHFAPFKFVNFTFATRPT
jgi:hypothetical protein